AVHPHPGKRPVFRRLFSMFVCDHKALYNCSSQAVSVDCEKAHAILIQGKAVKNQRVMCRHENLPRFRLFKQPPTHGPNQSFSQKWIETVIGIINREKRRCSWMETKYGGKKKVKCPFVDLINPQNPALSTGMTTKISVSET